MDGTRLVITEPAELLADFANGELQVYTSLFAEKSVIVSFVLLSPDPIEINEGDTIALELVSGDTLILEIFKQPIPATTPRKKLTCNVLLTEEQERILQGEEVVSIAFLGVSAVIPAARLGKREMKIISAKVTCITKVR
jgi:hypothetical protein